MKHSHRILVVMLVAACALTAVATASAKKPPPAPAPDLTALASEGTEAVGSGPLAASELGAAAPAGADIQSEALGLDAAQSVVADSSSTAALAACWWAQVRRYGKNLLGMTLWSYYQRIEWCSNGSWITSHTRIRWGEVSMPGWSFKGHIGSTTGGGNGSTFYRARTQGHFCLIQYFSCVQNAYPWIDMTVYRNGTYSYSTGG
jgi:hypothetical protein